MPSGEGGVATIVKNLVKFGRELGYQSDILLVDNKSVYQKYLVNENLDYCLISSFEYDPKNNIYFSARNFKKYIDGYDALVANDSVELRLVKSLKLNKPLLYIVHGDFDYYYQAAVYSQDYVDGFITYSSKCFTKLLTLLKPHNQLKVKNVYYPADVAQQNFPASKLVNNTIKIVFAGSLNERKGAHLLPEIVLNLDNKEVIYELTVAGDGEYFDLLSEGFNNNAKVTLVGHVEREEVLNILKRCDVLILPTKSEGLPNVLLEALTCRVIPIATYIDSGIPDVIEQGVNGFFFDYGDTETLATYVHYLAEHPEVMEKMKDEGDRVLLSKFDKWKQTSEYYEFIERACVPNCRKDFSINRNGSVLDIKYLPNPLTRILKNTVGKYIDH